MPRRTHTVAIGGTGIGTKQQLLFHHFGPKSTSGHAYIQATLHADELPGLLVVHHLLALLEAAEQRGDIVKEIVLVPYANPIGLQQQLLHSHIGRFSTATGVNFNRDWPDLTDAVAERVAEQLMVGKSNNNTASTTVVDAAATVATAHNVELIRAAMLAELAAMDDVNTRSPAVSTAAEDLMKRQLLMRAISADIVLDLHCDTEAVMHMYTHDCLWPQLSDLAAELGAESQLLDADSGGNCFDEVCSFPWAKLARRFPNCSIPMACQSTTVELRGQFDVSDELALRDAKALFRFLQRRGYVLCSDDTPLPPLPPLKRDARLLTAVDMIKVDVPGVVVWKVSVGDEVIAGQLLGEIVDIENSSAPRTAITSRTDGVIYSRRKQLLAVPGDILIKVSGLSPLPWRTGKLLTSR